MPRQLLKGSNIINWEVIYMIYILLGIAIGILSIIWICHRKKWAIRKTKCISDVEKLSYINAILNPFGFEFDYRQDIVISSKDAWQKEVGYTDFYDIKAPLFNIVMDSLPVYFNYDGKEYRIEFWKGQYGITTGGEIGVYVKDSKDNKGNFYKGVDCNGFLEMCFSLYKKCLLFSREDVTWWLTGFDVGRFSWPKDLVMKVCINFRDRCMRDAFVEGLLSAGYACNKINCCGNYVCFDYCEALNYKLNKQKRIIKFFVQIVNKINCSLYMFVTRYFNRTLDKLTYLRFLAPCLYRAIVRASVPRRKMKKSHKK